MIKIVKLIKTCKAWPAQWDAWTNTGEKWYIRYRWGRLAVQKCCCEIWPKCECLEESEYLLDIQMDDQQIDGEMEESELRAILINKLKVGIALENVKGE